ncbi:hypothetical protein MMC11_006243 [Xylographa trunciseda]|nr:hypothetical protein [Xylographa trunciseda]
MHASYPVQQYLEHVDHNPALMTHGGTDPKTKSQDMANHLNQWEDHWQSISQKDITGRGPKL